ncbi:MAG: zinc metallopeptidase [Vampirovibrionales bacterium]|nr:zinc metallopeptidase [Vampirovibrionales bacterium]
MFYMDPGFMLVSLIGMGLAFIPQMWLKNTYSKYSEQMSARGYTGAQVAEAILRDNQLHNIPVELTPGELSDHYDPMKKAVRLSEGNFNSRSIAGIAVAAHEVGHAIQHAKGYQPVVWRSALLPAVNIGSNLGPILLMIALGIGFTSKIVPDWAYMLAWGGLLLFSTSLLFQVVTLPVEIDASRRALAILSNGHYLTVNEVPAAKKVLTAAAMTYVAAALYSLIQVLYYAMRIMGLRRSEN